MKSNSYLFWMAHAHGSTTKVIEKHCVTPNTPFNYLSHSLINPKAWRDFSTCEEDG